MTVPRRCGRAMLAHLNDGSDVATPIPLLGPFAVVGEGGPLQWGNPGREPGRKRHSRYASDVYKAVQFPPGSVGNALVGPSATHVRPPLAVRAWLAGLCRSRRCWSCSRARPGGGNPAAARGGGCPPGGARLLGPAAAA